MCTFNFYFRPLKKGGERVMGSLCLRLTHQRKSRSLSLDMRLYQDEWDALEQIVVYPLAANERTCYLAKVEEKMETSRVLYAQIMSRLKENNYYNIDDVVDYYRNHNTPGSLSSFSRSQEILLEYSGQERTARAYRSAVRSLIQFNNNKNLLLKEISPELLKQYERSLKNSGKSLNTISFYMRNLRAIYNRAVTNKFIAFSSTMLFSGVYTGVDKTKKRALSPQEVAGVGEVDLKGFAESKHARLSRARRIFLFCFYARGMSFIDMAYLGKDNIRGGVISYYRKKTGRLIEIKLTPALREITDSFSKETSSSKYIFPIITDKDKKPRLQYENGLRLHNKTLKELAKLSGLEKPISSHVSRHSWATIAKYERLPLSVISEGLGHTDEKTTYIYLASFERSRLDDANDLVSQAVERATTSGMYSFN